MQQVIYLVDKFRYMPTDQTQGGVENIVNIQDHTSSTIHIHIIATLYIVLVVAQCVLNTIINYQACKIPRELYEEDLNVVKPFWLFPFLRSSIVFSFRQHLPNGIGIYTRRRS